MNNSLLVILKSAIAMICDFIALVLKKLKNKFYKTHSTTAFINSGILSALLSISSIESNFKKTIPSL